MSSIWNGAYTPTTAAPDEKLYNLLRPLPFILLLSVLFFVPQLFPHAGYDLAKYWGDVETYRGWTSIYNLSIPLFAVAVCVFLMGPKPGLRIWMHLMFCALYPLALGFSIWLWEWIGVVLMGFFLMITVGILSTGEDDEADTFSGVYFGILFGLYMILRVFKGHSGYQDIGLWGFYALYLLIKSVGIFFADKTWEDFKESVSLYFSVPLLISVFFAVLYLLFA